MKTLMDKRDPWGNGYAIWVLAGLCFFVPLFYFSLGQLELKNEVESWLPDSGSQNSVLNWYQTAFPDENRAIVTWNGSTLDDPRIPVIEKTLEGTFDSDHVKRGGSPYIGGVLTPIEVASRIIAQQVEPEAAIKRLEGVLIGRGPLKIQLTEAGRLHRQQTLEKAARLAEKMLGREVTIMPAASLWQGNIAKFDNMMLETQDDNLTTDSELEETAVVIDVPAPEIPVHDGQLYWQGILAKTNGSSAVVEAIKNLKGRTSQAYPDGEPLIENAFFSAGSPVAMIVMFTDAGQEHRKEALAQIKQACLAAGVPESELHMGGRPVAASTLNQDLLKAAWNPAAPFWKIHERSLMLTSCLLGFALTLLLVRSMRLSLLVLLVSIYTTIAALSLVSLTGGSMNLFVAIIPTLLFAVTLSGAVHLTTSWRQYRQEGAPSALTQAIKLATWPTVLTSVAMIVGLASLMTSTVEPVRQFGLYTSIGMTISAAIVLLGLPSLMQLWGSQSTYLSEREEASSWFHVGQFLSVWRYPVAAVSILLLAVGGYGLRSFQTETRVIKSFAENSRIVQDYFFIEDTVTGVVPVDAIIKFDQKFQEESQFLDRLEIVRRIEQSLAAHSRIAGTMSLADFRPVTEPPAADAPFFVKMKYNREAIEVLERIKAGEVEGTRNFLTFSKEDVVGGTPGDQLIAKAGDEVWRITAEAFLMTDDDSDTLLSDLDTIVRSELSTAGVTANGSATHLVTGMTPVFLSTQRAFVDDVKKCLALILIASSIVSAIMLRNAVAGLVSVLVNALPLVVVFGALSLAGVRADLGMVLSSMTGLALTASGTLHQLAWFREYLIRGKSRADAISLALSQGGPVIAVTSLIVAASLSVLAISNLPLLSHFGLLTAGLAMLAMLSTTLLLPALIATPLGGMIEKTVLREKSSLAEAQSANQLEPASEATDSALVPYTSTSSNSIVHGAHQAEQPYGPHLQARTRGKSRRHQNR